MSDRGSNLPDFVARQLDFAAHIRNPEANARPAEIDPRRMQIYLDLFYNNIEGFLAGAFPVAKRVLGGDRWHALVRGFVHRHPSASPYFLEISQEFLTFLHDDAAGDPAFADLPPFLLELCHYEWVELGLSVAEDELPEAGIDPAGDLLQATVVLSPLAWRLSYHYPVHRIGEAHRPEAPGTEPTHLVVYRRRDDQVRFLAVNGFTMRLLEHLEEGLTGAAALHRIGNEAPQLRPEVLREQGLAILEQLRQAEIILGTAIEAD